jgi:hypothetical protein
MKKSIFSIITALVFSLVLSLPAWSSSTSILTDSDLPPEFEARYEIHKGSIRVGEMKVSLKRIGDEIVYESKTKPVGMAAFFLGDQTINDRAVLKLINNSYRTIEFRHETYDKKKNRKLDIPEHTFDNYSAQLLLMREPVKENSGKEESINTYSVISKGRLKEYKYQQEAAEVVSTKLGDFNSNKYVRKKDNDKKTTYLGWYAEKLNYLPVKLDKFENGKLDVSIQITAIKWLNENSDGVN